jgi:hypothetical protein
MTYTIEQIYNMIIELVILSNACGKPVEVEEDNDDELEAELLNMCKVCLGIPTQ